MKLEELLKQDLKDYQSIPFWSWNDKLEEGELRRQIAHMKHSGIGGFIMHARGGLKTEYLSDDWMEATKTCLDEAKKQGMNAWCYDENGWPSGFAGMKLLEDNTNWAHYVKCEIKDSFDESSLAVYKLENNRIIRLTGSDSNTDKYICIYDRTNSSVVDILNQNVVQKFIDETHEKYYHHFKENFGKELIGFFTDEPQYFRWDTAYSPVMLDKFREEYGEDILDVMGALFVECEQAFEFRFRYWRLMNKLFTESFTKKIFEWCEEHNSKLTGHAVEERALFSQMWCCAGVMPFYEYQHVPGIDWLGRELDSELGPKQVGSVAQQLGKKHVLTETFGCTGWDVTPKELKLIAEFQFVNGVNLLCQHLYPYSIRGQRKRDYPTFFGEQNPWVKDFRTFNDYFTTLGYILANSRENAKVAIIHPMHSAYLTYNRESDYSSVQDLEESFKNLIEKIGSANIGHHYIDEILLEKYGSVKNNKLVMGLCEYEYVIIPKMQNLDGSTTQLLMKYVKNGGKIWLEGEKPCFIDGRKANLDFLISNTTFEEMQDLNVYISDITTDIRSTYRSADFGDFVFALNTSSDTEYSVAFKINAKGAKLFDLETRQEKQLIFETCGNGIKIPLHFKVGQSYVIMIDDKSTSAEGNESTNDKTEIISIDTDVTIVGTSQNAMTVDYAQLSYDNITFESKMPIMALSDRLLKERKNRKLFLKYNFNVKEIPKTIFIEAERMGAINVWLNGQAIRMDVKGNLDNSFVRKDIIKVIKIGLNEVLFEIDYYQSEHVNHVLFDAGSEGTESLMNCLSYDTDIEAVYICGDFAVQSRNGYTDAVKNTSIADGDFYIIKSPERINTVKINCQGYPFFAGDFIFEKEFYIEKTDYQMRIEGRFAVAEVFLNDCYVTKLMFGNEFDVSKYLKTGNNKLKIRLTNSNRNIFGPFHTKDDPEPYPVWPNLFDMYGSWENGESPFYAEEYSFVNFGVTKIELW